MADLIKLIRFNHFLKSFNHFLKIKMIRGFGIKKGKIMNILETGPDVPKKIIEEHEEKEKRIEEIVNQIEKAYEENKSKLEETTFETVPIIEEEILPKIPEIKSEDLEGVLNQLLEKYKDKDYHPSDLGLLTSLINNRTIEEYVRKNQEEGKEEKDIQPLSTHLKVDQLERSISYLGYKNPEKSNLFIEGNCKNRIGYSAEGGKIEVNGNCNDWTGGFNDGCEIKINGNCRNNAGSFMKRGKIEIEGNTDGFAASSMEGGELKIKKNCNGDGNAFHMKGGKLIIEGDVKKFDPTAFNLIKDDRPLNKGEIWHKGKQMKRTPLRKVI